MINFWGTWCGPCIQEIPELKAAYQKFGSEVQFIGIAYDEEKDLAKLKSIIEDRGMEWPQVFQDAESEDLPPVIKMFAVRSYPTTFLIDKEGMIIYRGTGINSLRESVELMEKMIF